MSDDKAATTAVAMGIGVSIPAQRIAEVLCAGWEGGTGYWCRIMDTRAPKVTPAPLVLDEGRADGRSWPYCDYPLLTGGATICRLDDGTADDTDERYTPLVLDRRAVARGLEILATQHPRHFAAILTGDDDAETADALIQCALLGEVIYG